MSQVGETKTCKMCSMGIPVTARKCPYCHHWQHWSSLRHPLVVFLFLFIPMIVLYATVMATILPHPFREWERFPMHSDQVRITESTMEFGEDQCGPAVIVVGKVENLTPVDWKDVRFQIDFFNPKGQLFDTGQQEAYTWRLPAGQECNFKVSYRRQFPEKEYASHKVRVVSAVDSRQWP
jgi:hypothetical protein